MARMAISVDVYYAMHATPAVHPSSTLYERQDLRQGVRALQLSALDDRAAPCPALPHSPQRGKKRTPLSLAGT